MQAAVYRGRDEVRLETVPVPAIGPGELLIRVHTCGICGTDLKKISSGSHSAPRIFGHETAGEVAQVGEGVAAFQPGDRVVVFHHVPCGQCFYCRHKVFAQCPVYKQVGCTAGFEPAGGGFAEYVRVLEWIVARGVVLIPAGVSWEQASFVEPMNTCLKALAALGPQAGETVLVMGQGPIGIILAWLALSRGAQVITSDLYARRLTIAETFGIRTTLDASRVNVIESVRRLTEGRGADSVILAVAQDDLIAAAMEAARPGGRVLLFAQTVRGRAGIDPAAICVDEKTLLGSYSASIDLQRESARVVFSGQVDLARLISHRFPLAQAVEALRLAARPGPESLKTVIQPGSSWEGQAS